MSFDLFQVNLNDSLFDLYFYWEWFDTEDVNVKINFLKKNTVFKNKQNREKTLLGFFAEEHLDLPNDYNLKFFLILKISKEKYC